MHPQFRLLPSMTALTIGYLLVAWADLVLMSRLLQLHGQFRLGDALARSLGATAVLIFFIVTVLNLVRKSTRQFWYVIAIWTALALALSLTASFLTQIILPTPRPFVVFSTAPLIPHKADASFPSDHCIIAFVFTAVWSHRVRRYCIAAFILSILIGAARVYSGVHWMVDVVGAAAIAILAVAITERLATRISGHRLGFIQRLPRAYLRLVPLSHPRK